MRLLFIIPLIFSFSLNAQIIKAMRTSLNAFPVTGVHDGAFDDGTAVALGDTIHYLLGTDNEHVFRAHYASGDGGLTWIVKDSVPFSGKNACGSASHDGFIWVYGGNDYSGARYDAHKYSPATGWVTVATTMTGWDGRISCSFVWTGTEYIAIGGSGISTVIHTTDLNSWTVVSTLPSIMQNVAGATACYYNGAIYWAGGRNSSTGAYPGVVMKSTDNGATWTQIASGAMFQNKWPDLGSASTFMILILGTTGETGGSNLKGCYWSKDGITWNQLPYQLDARHATPVCTSSDGTYVISVMGNFWNDSWIFKDITK